MLEGNGYSQVMPNFVEEQEVFLKSLGQESDIVEKVGVQSEGNVLCYYYIWREKVCPST